MLNTMLRQLTSVLPWYPAANFSARHLQGLTSLFGRQGKVSAFVCSVKARAGMLG